MTTVAKGTVIPLSETISVAEAEKVAKQVKEEVKKHQEYLKELQGYRDETNALSKLVMGLPDSVSYNIMVPFGKAAFFPGRLIHTNEFLVLLGEGYYSERSAKQTVDILERRNEFLQSKIANVESHVADLEAEASFASNTAAEAEAGVVEIREEIMEGGDETFYQSSRSTSTKADAFDQTRSRSQGEASHSASHSHRFMDEDEEHNSIMARIEALEAAEEAAGSMSDEDEMSDEEESISNNDDVEDAEAITKSKSYLSKDQKATLLEKLSRSEVENCDGEDSGEEDGGSGSEEEYDIDEEDEEDRINHRPSLSTGADSERSGQGQVVSEMQTGVARKPPRPLSRFGREVQSVRERVDSELAQRPTTYENREKLEKIVPSTTDKDASCSGLEIPDVQGHNDLQKLKDWRTQESTKRGFVLGSDEEKRTTAETKNDLKESQKMGKPTPRQTQAFTGTVTEHISTRAFPSHTGTVAERNPRSATQRDAGKATQPITKPGSETDQQGEEQPARPVSRFRQMRQTGGR